MTILVDASVIVSMVTGEQDADQLAAKLDQHDDRLFCAVGLWEATLAIARKRTLAVAEAADAARTLLADLGCRMVSIDQAEARFAIEAHRRYGKGTGHRAKLNMGDCFAYGCAKANDAALLYKGDDFVHTDLA